MNMGKTASILMERCLEDKSSAERTTLENLRAEYEKIKKEYDATPSHIYAPDVGFNIVNPEIYRFLDPLEDLHKLVKSLSKSDDDEPAQLAEEIFRVISAIIIFLKYL